MDNQSKIQGLPRELSLVIRDRGGVLLDTPIENVTSKNDKGVFDCLNRHANFITLINEKLVIRHKGGKLEEMAIDHGVLKVRENRIYVYLGIRT